MALGIFFKRLKLIKIDRCWLKLTIVEQSWDFQRERIWRRRKNYCCWTSPLMSQFRNLLTAPKTQLNAYSFLVNLPCVENITSNFDQVQTSYDWVTSRRQAIICLFSHPFKHSNQQKGNFASTWLPIVILLALTS